MAASVESQRLISLSLGKIAQSRGQRGGINLHKNLLVASVLHKARAAYMMETYNFQCQQRAEQQQQHQTEVTQSPNQKDLSCSESAESVSCQQQAPTPAPSASMEVGQPATPATEGENRSTVSLSAPEESEASDKENSSPTEALSPVEGNDSSSEHLAAAALLAQDAMNSSSSKQQQTSGSPTCNGILKRRRDNPNASLVEDCPAEKKAKVVSSEGGAFSPPHLSFRPQSPCQFSPLNSDCSSDESSDCESDNEASPMHTEPPQISNLVTIFNSGFVGLCATTNSSSDQDKFSSLANLRSEASSPSPSSYARKMSEPSLMCSSEVGRLGPLPSAIVLSA